MRARYYLFATYKQTTTTTTTTNFIENWKNNHFWTKTTGLPLWKNVNFSTFSTSCFYSLERRFFVLESRKRHFPVLYCLKKKVGKMASFGQKPWELCKNVNFSIFWTSCFYSVERRLFVVEYRKRHFPFLYRLRKKVGKMVSFGQKPWVNPFGKMSLFRLFWTSCFYSLERRFFVLEYHKRHFPGPYCLKKKVGKMAIFGQQPWVNPFAKMWIVRFFEPLVFIA